LTRPPEAKLPDGFSTLPGLPRDQKGPVFAEPWQAQAFALTIDLCEARLFTWAEWVATLAGVLKEAGDSGEYYEHWLVALERISLAKGLTDTASLDGRKQAWADAYRRTPHGKPVTL
jgi:nitrile hydratase accessory protein